MGKITISMAIFNSKMRKSRFLILKSPFLMFLITRGYTQSIDSSTGFSVWAPSQPPQSNIWDRRPSRTGLGFASWNMANLHTHTYIYMHRLGLPFWVPLKWLNMMCLQCAFVIFPVIQLKYVCSALSMNHQICTQRGTLVRGFRRRIQNKGHRLDIV